MIELTAQTIDLVQIGIYSATVVFLGMLLVNGVSDLVIRLFGGDE